MKRYKVFRLVTDDKIHDFSGFAFDCNVKGKGRRPSTASVTIYNIRQNFVEALLNAKGKHFGEIIVNNTLLFRGRISEGNAEKGKVSVELGAFRESRKTELSYTWLQNTPIQRAVEQVCADIGESCFVNIPGNLQHALSVQGKADNVLTRLLGASWSFGKNGLQVGEKPTAFVFSAATGLVGLPVLTKKGCEIGTLLVPGIEYGSIVNVSSQIVSGNFVVTEYEHTISANNVQWRTTMTCRAM